MGLNYKKILGVNITIDNEEKILEEMRKYLKTKNKEQRTENKKTINPFIICTPNPEIVIYAQKDSVFIEIVNTAQINIPDGKGIVWALKKIFDIKIKPIPGADLMQSLCQLAAGNTYTIGLIGGRGGLALETRKCLRKMYPKLKIEVLGEPEVEIKNNKLQIIPPQRDPASGGTNYKEQKTNLIISDDLGRSININKYFDNLVQQIDKQKIDIILVAMGFPKQEYFISRLSLVARLAARQVGRWPMRRPLVMMGVGGSFDYIAGRVERAPDWMKRAGIEWLYRLLVEPWRIKRQLIGSQFFLRVIISTCCQGATLT